MPDIDALEFNAREINIKFRVRLLRRENPDVVKQVLDRLPFDSVLGHVVVSGETVWLPTRIVHLGGINMVERTLGSVYFFAPGQSICLTYGSITESTTVNTFGMVLDEDLNELKKLGQVVWQKTVADPRRELIKINVRAVS